MNSSSLLWLVLALALGFAVLLVMKRWAGRGSAGKGAIVARMPLTRHEQAMYWRLVSAFAPPAYVVLAQVSFLALLSARDRADRSRFARYVLD